MKRIILILILMCITSYGFANTSTLDGTFIGPSIFDYYGLTETELDNLFDEFEGLGLNTLIIIDTRVAKGYPSATNCNGTFEWKNGFPEFFDTIFDNADEKGIEIYVGLGAWPYWVCGGNGFDSTTRGYVISDTGTTVNYIVNKYGNRSSLAGWYIPQEIGIGHTTIESAHTTYYSKVVSEIRKYSNKPILNAPSLYTIEDNTSPSTVASRAKTLIDTGINILVPQDAVGSDSMNLGWDTSNYTVAQYYSAISSKIGKSKLWADNEFFTCCVFSTRSNTYGYSPSISRLNSQFKITEPYVSRNIAYTVPFYMSPVIEDISSFGQSRLLATYKAFYKIEGDYITPTSYTWTTTPSTTYPDSGNKLFDLESGYADYYKDSSWVGINKYTPIASEYAEVILDLGTEKKIDWIGVETLNWPSKLIEVPSEMQIYSSTNKTNWTLVGTYASANVQGGVDGGTYVIGNYSPLNTSARYFKIKLKNSGWVFVSEIEVVGACVGEAAKDYMEERNYPRQIEWAGLGSACCSSTECVGQNNSCFAGSWTNASSSGMHSGLNLNGNDNSAYCYAEGSWLDCDSWAAYCDDASVCGEADGSVPSGETTPFGEYSTFGEQECCGDDTGEYYITTGNYSACCNNNTDTINSTLNCIGEQNPICTEYPNDQYTLEQINDKISNWRNGNLTLIEILTATKIYKYC